MSLSAVPRFFKDARVVKRTLAISLVSGVLVAAAVQAAEQLLPKPWSSSETWQSGHVPRAGEDVTIPRGEKVVMDCVPPANLGRIDVDGDLIISDRHDVSFQTSGIDVHGLLQIGTEKQPFRHHCTITLTKSPNGADSKLIAVSGGNLEMHGAYTGVNWLHLAKTAEIGDATITLERQSNWVVGEKIVIASTDFDPLHAEQETVTGGDGTIITLSTPLQYIHWGDSASGVDERAEVGLLSRNIVIQGDDDSIATHRGGQIMLMDGTMAHIEGALFTHMGQEGLLGHYPLHFHLDGDVAGSYVRACSFSQCYNRCLTLHGTDGVKVVSNVAYDTIGHCYFFEDGVEMRNTLINNLGLVTRAAQPGKAILPSDLQPATYWITNPRNTLIGNVAAGSQGTGFWYNFPEHPTGPDRTPFTDKHFWPRRIPLGMFKDNVAHSNDYNGLFVDNGPNPPGVHVIPVYTPRNLAGKPVIAEFTGFTAYKNRKRAMWLRGDSLDISNAKLSDNGIGVTFSAADSTIHDSFIVGESLNVGTPPSASEEALTGSSREVPKPDLPHDPITGFEYYDGPVHVKNVTFVNFQSNSLRAAGALGVLRYTPWFLDPGSTAEKLTFINSDRVHFDSIVRKRSGSVVGDGYKSAAFVDVDGCVTGQPGTTVAIATPIVARPVSRLAGASFRRDWNAVIVPGKSMSRLFVDNKAPLPKTISPVVLSYVGDAASPHPIGTQTTRVELYGTPNNDPRTSFQSNVMIGSAYQLRLANEDSTQLRLALLYCHPGDVVTVTLPLPQGKTVQLYGDNHFGTPLPVCQSFDQLASLDQSAYMIGQSGVRIRMVVPLNSKKTMAVVTMRFS